MCCRLVWLSSCSVGWLKPLRDGTFGLEWLRGSWEVVLGSAAFWPWWEYLSTTGFQGSRTFESVY